MAVWKIGGGAIKGSLRTSRVLKLIDCAAVVSDRIMEEKMSIEYKWLMACFSIGLALALGKVGGVIIGIAAGLLMLGFLLMTWLLYNTLNP